MRKMLLLVLPLIVLMVAGCAGPAYAPDVVEKGAKEQAVAADRAALYVYRERAFVGSMARMGLAVDGKIVGWNPQDGYLRVDLLPGLHRFQSVLDGDLLRISPEIELLVEAGREYFLMQNLEYSMFSGSALSLAKVDNGPGKAAVAECKHSRFDARNLTVKDLVDKRRLPTKKPSQPTAGGGSSDSVSSVNFNVLLEGLALVLLFGLAIYGASHGGSAMPDQIPNGLLNPSVIERRVTTTKSDYGLPKNYLSTTGDIYTTSNGKIFSPTRGDSWTVSGNSIRGTDGSLYRIQGNRVYSDSGQMYRVDGNNILGSDGSLCTVTGNLISCK